MERMPPEPVDRRPLLKVIAGATVTLAGVGVGSRAFLHRDGAEDDDGGPALTLSAEAGSDVDSLSVALGDRLLPQTGSGRWESARLPTTTHSMVALNWTDPTATPHARIRSRVRGRWGEWQRVPLLHDRPDVGTREDTAVLGTALVWIGRADGIQIQLGGRRPDDLRLLLLHPRPHPRDRAPAALAMRTASGAVVTRPDVLNRVDWGADESWRSGQPQVISTIQQIHVHHTVSRNDYLPEDVPALIRGMYRYHTKTLGWSDIAYNFLVDRFGRVWTGRAGGAARPIRGAHTLGFNATSCGISAIGNYDLVAPPAELLAAVALTAAWKLNINGGDPLGTTTVTSDGSDRFRRGTAAALPVIDGHRDTNDTACPGSQLYAALPDIRARARAVVDAAITAASAPVAVTSPATIDGRPALGKTLTAAPGAYDPPDAAVSYAWTRDGVDIAGASGPTYVVTADDVGRTLGLRVGAAVDLRTPATQSVTVAAPATAPGVVTLEITPRPGRAVVRVTVAPPPGVLAPAEGQVLVRTGDKTHKVTLRNGYGITRFRRLEPGRRGFKATYAGSGLLTRGVVVSSAMVP